MEQRLDRKVGKMEYDGLLVGLNPAPIVGGGEIAALAEEGTIKRGTLLAKADGVLYVYNGANGTPDCILCDDVVVGTDGNVETAVYISGCFNQGKVEEVTGYALTEGDKDTLRTKNIYFKAPLDAN